MTCAVPVLPDTSYPLICALCPVPAPLTTRNRPSRIACSLAGSSAACDFAPGRGTGFQPLPSSTALSRCGVTRVPPLASGAAETGIDTGVTETEPLPIRTETGSRAYHL